VVDGPLGSANGLRITNRDTARCQPPVPVLEASGQPWVLQALGIFRWLGPWDSLGGLGLLLRIFAAATKLQD
jgi:hypothetical protein